MIPFVNKTFLASKRTRLADIRNLWRTRGNEIKHFFGYANRFRLIRLFDTFPERTKPFIMYSFSLSFFFLTQKVYLKVKRYANSFPPQSIYVDIMNSTNKLLFEFLAMTKTVFFLLSIRILTLHSYIFYFKLNE